MATNGWIGEQTVHSWGKYNSRLTTNVYINGIRRYSDHIDVSGVIYLFCKSSGARTVWYDWAITAWCGGRNLGLIKSRTYNNNILGKSWSKNFSIRINCSNSATSATFQVGFSDSNMGGKDKYWTLYFDRYATSPSGITSVAGYTQYSTISTSCSGINWGQGYSSRKLTCTASYTYNGKTENFTLGTWTDGATSKSVTKTDFNFPADLNVTVKWTASTNIGSTSSTAQIKVKQTFPAPNLSNTTFTAESTAPYCIRVNVSGVDFGDNYSAQKLELYGTYELDGIIYDNKLGEIFNQTSWTLEYDASQEAEPWTKIPDDSSILLRLVADNGNRTSDKTIIINCQSSYEAYVIEHISEEEKEKSEVYTGKNIQIQNAPKDAPLSSVQIDGETSQQTYSGKNLLKLPATATANNVTFTNNGDGTFNISTSGTASAHTEFAVVVPLAQSGITGGQSYTVSSNATISSSALNLWVHSCSPIGAWSKTLMTFTSAGTRTAEAPSTDYIKFVIGVESGKTVNFSNVKLQLEKGSSATSFEPYVGGTASPNPDYPQAVQTVTGENTVKIHGKNLLEFSNADNSDRSSFTYSVETPEKVVATKNVSGGKFLARYTAYFEANKTYVFNMVAGADRWVYIYYDRLWGSLAGQIRLSLDRKTFTPTISGTYIVGFYTDGAAGTFELTNPIAELGSTATAYEPYQGQSYEVNLGKNLFNVNSITENTQATTNGVEDHEVTYSASNYRAIMLINVEPNSKYTLSIGDTNIVSRIYCVGMKTTTLESGHSFGWVNSGTTITTAPKDNYILGVLNISSGQGTIANVTNANVQLEKGSTPTSYAAYFEPIELCKLGNAQDYIFKSGDKWYVHKAVGKLNCGDYTWSWDSSIPRVSLSTAGMGVVPPGGNQYPFLAYSNKFKADTFTHVYTEKNNGMAFSTSGFISLVDTSWTSQAEANSDIQDAVIYYALQIAYRTDTEITNEALIEQLDAILNSGRVYEGTNNITTITQNEQGTLEIQYYTKWQNTSPAILSANGRNGTGNFKQIRRIGTK